jgi:heme exporter protein B
MPKFWRTVYWIYLKDLKEEFRSTDHLLATLVFGTMLVFVFSFALELVEVSTDQVFPAALWVSVFFMAILALQRSFAKEREGGTLDALLVVSRERSVLFYAKFLASFTILLLLEVVVVPLLWILIEVTGPKVNLWLFLASVFLGSWGLAAVGTLLSGITAQLPGARLLFPILAFPILIPLLIGAVLCTQGALLGEVEPVLGWFYLLLIFDLLFTILPLVLFDYVVEG